MIRSIARILLGAALGWCWVAPAPAQPQPDPSLYRRAADSIWCVTGGPGDPAVKTLIDRLARNQQDARALAQSLLPEPPGGWRPRWDVKPIPSAYATADEYWKAVVIPGLDNFGGTEQEVRDCLGRWVKTGQLTERQAAITLYQNLAADCLPTWQRFLLTYDMRRVLDALGRNKGQDFQDFQKRSVTELCALDAGLSDEQARERFVKLATLVQRRTRLTFDKCSGWPSGGQSGPELAQNGIKVCEATIDIILIAPARTAEITDLPAGEAAAAQAKLQQALKKIFDEYIASRETAIDAIRDGNAREQARRRLAIVQGACNKAQISVQSHKIGAGGHVAVFSDFEGPPPDRMTSFANIAIEPMWGGPGVVLPYGSRSLWGQPERVCVAWMRNGSALVQVTLEGNLPAEEMLKETDFWLSTMEGKTGVFGGVGDMLKTFSPTPAPTASPTPAPTAAPTPKAPPAAEAKPTSGGAAVAGANQPFVPLAVAETVIGEHLAKKEYAQAEALCQSAQKRDPKNSKWAVGFGKVYAAQDRWEEAAKAFQQALQLNAEDPGAHNGRGLVLARQGQHEEAMEEFFEAAHRDPETPEYFINAAESLLALGRREEALLWAKQAIARGVQQHPVFDKLGLKP